MLRRMLLALSDSGGTKEMVQSAPLTRGLVHRFVAGETPSAALGTAGRLLTRGLAVGLDPLVEDTLSRDRAAAVRDIYVDLLRRSRALGAPEGAVDVSVKLSAVGQFLPRHGEKTALENAHAICAAAAGSGATVTLETEDHTTTESTLAIARELRADFPTVGVVLQSRLRRTEGDCRELTGAGVRVRLSKGAYAEQESVAFAHRAETDRSFVRCLRMLMAGDGHPVIATHDARLLRISAALAARYERPLGSYEYQMLYGVAPEQQTRLAAGGETVRVHVPYGAEWYGYFLRRLAEQPSNLAFFLRSAASRD
ncbi:proline dehydrogenase [Mangrovactinospora gilvigrisea]|uniref:proline dehydrogenase n=1 Tax=Mangrovactinospora gilvigrisea TaxID=1428644 RepID=A0A1J7CC85_9ACTN|nr:proline dehydrogenase family protein [Mangrovactinospora gilvigrisea]OIV37290.1 proline dehydrogenase [Mangrovactinospora gilvigrisea]